MNDIKIVSNALFESIKQTTEDNLEYWSARDLMVVLEYKDWRKFQNVINKAKKSCEKSKQKEQDHFVQMDKMINLGKGAERMIDDLLLTRYACYLIAQNGDSTKEAVAFAQTYFALQTHRQEVLQQRLRENERLEKREQLKDIEGKIEETVYQRGIEEPWQFAKFKDEHIKALYGGLSTKQLKKMRNIPEKRPLADFDNAIELGAKFLSYALTDKNIVDRDLQGETELTKEATENANAIRNTLLSRGVTPESLSPEEDIKKIQKQREKEAKKLLKNN